MAINAISSGNGEFYVNRDDPPQDNPAPQKGHPDVSIRTIQFINGTNLSFFGAGYGTNFGKTSLYGTTLAGKISGSNKPCFGVLGMADRRYTQNDNKVWLSQELYGEYVQEPNSPFNAKITYTPVKLNAQVAPKVNVSFDPRVAVNMTPDGVSPSVETLTTVSTSITKNLSAYAILQTYDFKGTTSINGGVVWTF